MNTAENLLQYWFGEITADELAEEGKPSLWFTKNPATDQYILDHYRNLYEEAVTGKLDGWLQTPRGTLAFIVLLDQFSRNMFRGDAKMYDADPLALKIVHEGLQKGTDRTLKTIERFFFYMPLMHSELLEDQERCIQEFEALHTTCPEAAKPTIANNIKYAIAHRDIVRDWGRFPHRNEILGRASTPEEIEFLKQPNSSF